MARANRLSGRSSRPPTGRVGWLCGWGGRLWGGSFYPTTARANGSTPGAPASRSSLRRQRHRPARVHQVVDQQHRSVHSGQSLGRRVRHPQRRPQLGQPPRAVRGPTAATTGSRTHRVPAAADRAPTARRGSRTNFGRLSRADRDHSDRPPRPVPRGQHLHARPEHVLRHRLVGPLRATRASDCPSRCRSAWPAPGPPPLPDRPGSSRTAARPAPSYRSATSCAARSPRRAGATVPERRRPPSRRPRRSTGCRCSCRTARTAPHVGSSNCRNRNSIRQPSVAW